MFFPFRLDTVVNIGAASLTAVDDKGYQIPFKFTGKIDKITIKLGPPELTPEDIKRLKEAEMRMDAPPKFLTLCGMMSRN